VIGGYLAEAQGEPQAVADAIRDHYKPVGQGDEVPTTPVTCAVALADKLDALGSLWAAGLKPTGSKDPYALRRAAIGAISIVLDNNIRTGLMPLLDLACVAGERAVRDTQNKALTKRAEALRSPSTTVAVGMAVALYASTGFGKYDRNFITSAHEILEFFADRLKVQQREAGVRHDLIDAVFALGGEDDLVRLLARVNALQSFVETADGADLLTAYRRAANILKKENWTGGVMTSAEEQGIPQTGEEDPLVLVDEPILKDAVAEMASGKAGADLPQEKALIAALDGAEPKASVAIEKEDFTAAMAALASLRRPIDDFFDHVTVNDTDPAKRERRLNLLMRFRDAVNRVADFSRIEG
jgi:glycyl-tRNA synthetase beta chain